MFFFCSHHRMTHAAETLRTIPPMPVAIRFIPATPPGRALRRAMRDFTGFLTLAWAAAEIALWAGGA